MTQTIILRGQDKNLIEAINDSHKEMSDAGYKFKDLAASYDSSKSENVVFITYKKK